VTLSRERGQAGSDVLSGGEGNDRLVGHPGAILDGGKGGDRHELWGGATGGPIGVVFARGGGHDSIMPGVENSDSPGNLSFDIRIGEIAYRDLVVERDGEDLVLRIRDSQDRMAVPDFFAHEGAVIDWIGAPVAPRLLDFAPGRALLDATLEALKAKGAPRVVLSTAERNESAQRLFARAGFRRTMIEMTRESGARPLH